jgi:hypothetical protein
MEQHEPDVYAAILKADRMSMEYFGGYGSAMAQVYNHIIMPLANARDQQSQVIWGLQDFKSRFGREAEGMWVAETAVNIQTLEVLADHGIKFTVLAPRQALRFRKLGGSKWTKGIDSKRHYVCQLPNGKKIVLFFYDEERSQEVAFNGLLKNGREFAESLISSFDNRKEPQLVHIATDGESYGHHHRHGDMALAFCCQYVEAKGLAQLTNYSQFMHLVEAEYEVEIQENTSWSCFHGIERWRSNCGCGSEHGYHQRWRAPLRESLNWLRDQLSKIYQEQMAVYHQEPWKLRDEYVQVILNRGEDFVNRFLKIHCGRELQGADRTRIIRLLEMQRQSLLMFTSCGWFFEEVSRIETIQILQYANRAIQLAEIVAGINLEGEFMEKLIEAKSNDVKLKNAALIYEKQICPKRISLTKVGMHYAVASLFDDNPEKLRILNYSCSSDPFERYYAGVQILAIGRTEIKSMLTFSKKQFSFAVLYIGQHHIIGSALSISEDIFNEMKEEIVQAFKDSKVYQVVDIMQQYFGGSNFSFFELFKDERTKVLKKILESSVESAANSYKRIFDRNYNLLNVIKAADMAVPSVIKRNTEIVINIELHQSLQKPDSDLRKLKHLVEEVEKWQIPVEKRLLSFETTNKINGLIQKFLMQPDNPKILKEISEVLSLVEQIDLDPSLNMLQNQLLQIGREFAAVWSGSKEPTQVSLLKAFQGLTSKVQLEISIPESIAKQ